MPTFLPVTQFTTHAPSQTPLHHYGNTISSPFLIIPMRYVLSQHLYWTHNNESDQISLTVVNSHEEHVLPPSITHPSSLVFDILHTPFPQTYPLQYITSYQFYTYIHLLLSPSQYSACTHHLHAIFLHPYTLNEYSRHFYMSLSHITDFISSHI